MHCLTDNFYSQASIYYLRAQLKHIFSLQMSIIHYMGTKDCLCVSMGI